MIYFHDIAKIINKKRVCLVGPSRYLYKKGIGKKIDEYDIVCRVNDFGHDYKEDYGSKNDIIFFTCATYFLEWFKYKLEKNLEQIKNIKYVISTTLKTDIHFSSTPEKNFSKINSYNIPFFQIEDWRYKSYHEKVGCETNSGIAAILLLLDMFPKELFVTGFSFYSEGKTYEECYYPGHFPEEYQEKNNEFNPHVGHNQIKQKEYFKKEILCHPRLYDIIKIDSYLKGILEIKI